MKTGTEKWKNGKQTIDFAVAICDCGGTMKEVGAAGCSHNDDYTYFYQCPECKMVETSNYRIRTESMETLKLHGWKKVK